MIRDRRYKCEQCTKYFLNNEFLQKHFNQYHTNLAGNVELGSGVGEATLKNLEVSGIINEKITTNSLKVNPKKTYTMKKQSSLTKAEDKNSGGIITLFFSIVIFLLFILEVIQYL